MNSFGHAQKGFKTFLITLTISLAVFTALYYLLSGFGEKDGAGAISQADVQDYMAANSKTSPFEDLSKEKMDVSKRTVLSDTDTNTDTTPQPTPPTRLKPTPPAEAPSVLAGSDTTTTTASAATPQTTTSATTVPATGTEEITMALIASAAALLFGFYILYIGPRRMALKSFERTMTQATDFVGKDFDDYWG